VEKASVLIQNERDGGKISVYNNDSGIPLCYLQIARILHQKNRLGHTEDLISESEPVFSFSLCFGYRVRIPATIILL